MSAGPRSAPDPRQVQGQGISALHLNTGDPVRSAADGLVLASRGDALTPYLAGALERRFPATARIDPELTARQRYLVAARTVRPTREAWAEAFYKSELGYRLRSANGGRQLRQLGRPHPPVLQVHALFELEGAREVLYVDCTHHQAAEAWPAWNPLRGAAQRRWYGREQRAYRRAAHIFAFSEATRVSLVRDYGIDRSSVTVVGAGVNFMQLPPPREQGRRAPDGAPSLLFVGNDFERKGGPVLLDAFRTVRGVHPRARLVLIGTRPDIRPQPGVEVLGRVRDRDSLVSRYREADIFVLPSVFDPLPLVLLEAMAFGLPCVTTASCGIPDVLTDRRDGLLVPPADAAALSSGLLDLIGDPQLAERLGAAGRRRVESSFTWDHVVDRMAPVLEQLAGTPPQRRAAC